MNRFIRPSFISFVAILAVWCAASAQAQVSSTGLIEPEIARRFGLERMWFTHLNLDRGRGRVAGLHLHVSGSEGHTIFRFILEGKPYLFSQFDRNAFGEQLGVEGAKAKADETLAEMMAELAKAGKTDVQPPAVETHVVPKMTLYATSQRGTVHAIDAETGRTLWSTAVGSPQFPTTAPAANDKFVGVINGSTLYILQAENGSLAWSRVCVGAPGAGPALTSDIVYVPMISGQMEVRWLDDPKLPVPNFKSFGRAMVQPAVSLNSVAWPTDLGNLYVALADRPGMRFRLEAGEAIDAAPAFLEPDKLFATSRDGYVYCVNEEYGNVIWRFTTGESISHSPVALGNYVYAITQRGHMFAVNVENGQDLNDELKDELRQQAKSPAELEAAQKLKAWPIPGMRNFVAGNDKRLYVCDNRGNLVIIHPRTGARLGSIAAAQSDLPLLNVHTDRIILASSTGLVQCLRETNLTFPVVHYRIEAKKPAALAKRPPAKSASDAAPMPPTSTEAPPTDPFAAPATTRPAAPPPGEDPFAPPR
jgi:outer membrane protein assembly factor BamB